MQIRRCIKWDYINHLCVTQGKASHVKAPQSKACGYSHGTAPQAEACGYSHGIAQQALAVVFLFIFFLLHSLPAYAEIQWSLSAVEGLYLPRLKELNYLLKHREVELGPRNVEAKPFSYPVIYQGASPDDMPKMGMLAPKTGVQIQADITPNLGIEFGSSIAVFESSKRDVREFFVGFIIPSDRETRVSLVLNQFWFGIKRYWAFKEKSEDRSKKQETPPASPGAKGGGDKPSSRFYTEIGILAVTRASLTTDVWMHVYAPEEGFDFYKITETESTGNGFATFMGAGGEYFVYRWLSLGMDISYVVGGVSKLKFTNYFTVDPLEKDIIKKGDVVLSADYLKGGITPLYIDLEGWDVKGQVRFYF